MIAAALGRCDPSHVFWNGLATFLASLLYMSLFRKAWPVYALAYLLFVFLLPNASEFYLFVPQVRAARYLDKHPQARPTEAKIQQFLASWPGNYVAPFGFRPRPRRNHQRLPRLIGQAQHRPILFCPAPIWSVSRHLTQPSFRSSPLRIIET